jgi:putative transposase
MATDHRKVSEQLAQEILLEDPNFLREIVERALQGMLEAEMTEHIGAAPYERSATRTGHRNGYKPRTLRTGVGTLNLSVPQDREGAFSTHPFSRYQRNEKALCLALMEMYVEGVSNRKVKDITEELCGTSFSKSLVSQLAGSLDSELEAWRGRVDSKLRPTPTCSWTSATRRSGWIIRWLTGAFWSSRALGTTASGRCLA